MRKRVRSSRAVRATSVLAACGVLLLTVLVTEASGIPLQSMLGT